MFINQYQYRMTRSVYMAQRLREVWLSGRWIANTNYRELLSDLSREEATTCVAPWNTIAALTFHIRYYMVGISAVLDGGPLSIRDQYSFDLPPIAAEADWQAMVQSFFHYAETVSLQVEALPDEQWDAVFTDEKYGTYLRNIEGMIEHSYYHMGQIALLKKLIRLG